MQTQFFNEKEYLSKAFSAISAINQEICNFEFEGCHFQDCNFTDSTFNKCKFIECTFTRCNFSVVKVNQSRFTDVEFYECKMVGIDWTMASWPRLVFSVSINFNKCIISNSSFFGLKLDEIKIHECKAHDVDFRGGSFCRADFTYTDFANGQFGKANLCGADFSEATNYDIDIFSSKITRAKFSRHEAVRLLNSLDVELVD